MQEDTIRKNFKEFFELGEFAFKTKKYNAATTLYYKALVEICDIELLRKIKKIGSSHTERFSLLKTYNPELYDMADTLFKYYRDSYSKEISYVIANQIRENVKKAKQLVGIE